MRPRADADRIRAFLRELARHATRPATLYLAGGTTAVLEGWRSSTIDIDIRLEPELDELLRALPGIKERLRINVELASPLDFLPELPGWRDRSPFVAQEAQLTVRHIDLVLQALAKLERGFDQDLADAQAMLDRGLISVEGLRTALDAMVPQLYRFPAVDPAALRAAVDRLDPQQGRSNDA